MNNPSRNGVFLMLVTSLGFSCSDIGIKVLGENLSAWQFVAGRGLLGMAVVLVIIRFKVGLLLVSQWRAQLLLGFASALGFTFFILSIKYLPLSISMPLAYFYPALAAIMSPLVNNEKPSREDWLAISLGLGGVILFSRSSGGGSDSNLLMTGIIFGLIGALFVALMVSMARRQSRSVALTVNLFYLYMANAVTCLPLSLMFDAPLIPATADLAKLFLFIAPVSIMSFGLMFVAFRYISAHRGSTILMLEAAIAAVYGMVILNEPLNIYIILGGLLMLASAIIITRAST